MPKTIYIPQNATHSGVSITYTKSSKQISISGWYDGFVGIQGESMSLGELLSRLEITEKDCVNAFKNLANNS